VAQGRRGQVVVGVREGVTARIGEGEDPGRAPPPALATHRAVPALDPAECDESLEVPAHRRWTQTQLTSQVGSGGRAILEQEARDAITGADV